MITRRYVELSAASGSFAAKTAGGHPRLPTMPHVRAASVNT
jgi:hypothetical protein